jgi:hypothetical protein
MFDVLFQKIAVNHVRFSQNQNRKNKIWYPIFMGFRGKNNQAISYRSPFWKYTLAKSLESIFLRFSDLNIQGLSLEGHSQLVSSSILTPAQENSVFWEWQFWLKWPKINFKTQLLKNEGLPFDAQWSKLLFLLCFKTP